jgi:hypothetical protein
VRRLVPGCKARALTKCVVIELARNVKEVLEFLINYGFKIKKANLPAYIIACKGEFW